MQTTLRISDAIYREAKAEAAREGVTLTRFIEDGIRLRLKTGQSPKNYSFRVYDPGTPFPFSDAQIRNIADDEQEKHDLAKLEIPLPNSNSHSSNPHSSNPHSEWDEAS